MPRQPSLCLWRCQPTGGGREDRPASAVIQTSSRSLPTFASTPLGRQDCATARGTGPEFSEIVGGLLAKWLKARS